MTNTGPAGLALLVYFTSKLISIIWNIYDINNISINNISINNSSIINTSINNTSINNTSIILM